MPAIRARPALEGEERCDIAIIGGGFTGLSTAFHARRLLPGADVRVLEANVCGFGASGRNGGFSMTLFGLTKGITAFRFGTQKAIAAHHYMEEAVDYLDGIIRKHRIACDYERSGYLLVATSEAQRKRVEHELRLAERWKISGVETWDESRLRAEFSSPLYRLGWYEPRCGILNPAKLARGWMKLAQKTGAHVYENTPVSSIEDTGREFRIGTQGGSLRAQRLVFATNAYSILFGQLASKQSPAFTHVVLSEPLTRAQMRSIGWRARCGVEDARNLIHYYRLTKDNRILMGGGDVSIAYGTGLNRDHNAQTFAHLRKHVTEVFPELQGLRFTHAWGGPVSITVDMAPAIGRVGRGGRALYSFGTIGHGVSMTAYNGLTLAEMLAGKTTPRTQMFFVGRRTIPWPPHPIRFPITHAIRAGLRVEDALRWG